MGLYKIPKVIGIDRKPSFGTMVNWHHPLSQGLIGAWLFNEGGGNSAFNNLDGKSATLTSGVSWSNNQVYFTTVDERINVGPDPKLAINDPFTISMRLKDANPLEIWRAFLSKRLAGSGYILRVGPSQTPIFSNYSTGAANIVSTQLPSKTTNMVFRRFGTNCSWFYDGILQPDDNGDIGTLTYSSSFDCIIGNYDIAQSGFGYVGFMDYVYIWNRALTDEEIISLHANPYQMFWHPMKDIYIVPAAAPPPAGGRSIFGYDNIFHSGGIIQT